MDPAKGQIVLGAMEKKQLGTSAYTLEKKIPKDTHNYWYLSDDTAIVRCARKKHQWAHESDCGLSETPLMGVNQKKL